MASNAMFNPMRPQNMGAGLYPGSGVAIGGRQARSGLVTGGAGGVLGGGYATPNRGQVTRSPGFYSPPPVLSGTGGGAPGVFSFAHNNGAAPVIGVGRDPGFGGPTISGGVHPPSAVVDPFAQYSPYGNFLQNTGELNYQLANTLNPLQAHINQLNTRYVSGPNGAQTITTTPGQGQTLYDMMLQQAQGNLSNNLREQMASAARKGLLHSGYFDQQKAALQNQYLQNATNLNQSQGQSAVQGLEQQIGAAQNQHDIQLARYRLSAIQDALAHRGQDASQAQAIYDKIFPSR